jgi:branched-chain amino acid transport system substrate-binding protein
VRVISGEKAERRFRGRVIAVGCVAALAMVAACSSSSKHVAAGSGPFLIASPVDLTGANAQLGKTDQEGLNAAVQEVNSHGGILGRQVQVDYVDTRSDPQGAAQALSEMLASKNYAAVIPSSGGSTTLPLLQIIKSKAILGVLVGSEAHMGDPTYYPTVFVTASSFAEQGTDVGCTVDSYHPQRVAFIHLDDPFNNTVTSSATQLLTSKGVQVVDTEAYSFTQLDVTAQVQRIMQSKPDVLVLSSFYFKIDPVLKAMQDLNFTNVQVVGDSGVSSGPPGAVLSSMSEIPKGMVAISAASDVRIGGTYTSRQNQVISLLQPTAGGFKTGMLSGYLYNYDALQLVKWAADKAGSDTTPAMVKALETLNAHPSDTGALAQPDPPFSPTNHQYTGESYYVSDYTAPTVNGTFVGIKSVPKC